jgi:hypothetical protein
MVASIISNCIYYALQGKKYCHLLINLSVRVDLRLSPPQAYIRYIMRHAHFVVNQRVT